MPFSLKHWKRLQGLGDVKTDIHGLYKPWKTVVKSTENPARAKQKAPGAILPLHLALKYCAPLAVIEALLTIYPKSIKKDRKESWWFPSTALCYGKY